MPKRITPPGVHITTILKLCAVFGCSTIYAQQWAVEHGDKAMERAHAKMKKDNKFPDSPVQNVETTLPDFVYVQQWDYEIDGISKHTMMTQVDARRSDVMAFIRRFHRVTRTLLLHEPVEMHVQRSLWTILNIPQTGDPT